MAERARLAYMSLLPFPNISGELALATITTAVNFSMCGKSITPQLTTLLISDFHRPLQHEASGKQCELNHV